MLREGVNLDCASLSSADWAYHQSDDLHTEPSTHTDPSVVPGVQMGIVQHSSEHDRWKSSLCVPTSQAASVPDGG